VLFVMRHSGYVRNFESTLRMLCDRGHRVTLAFQNKGRHTLLDPADTPRQLSEQYSNFSYGDIPLRTDGWGLLGRELRRGIDYLRYLRPEYREAPKLRERASREVAPGIVARAQQGFTGTPLGRWALATGLRLMDRAIPRDPAIDAYLAKIGPDVLAVTPLLELGAPQSDFVRSARALGVRTALCVASWDNLTNKGVIHGPVDLVAVWNEAMKREAVRLHGIPARDVVVTGAAAFDHWFDWRPSTTREEFCSRVGLPLDCPYLLYLCSSRFVAPEEVPFVRRWVEQIRQSSSAALRRVSILIRPHPQNADQWKGVDLSGLGDVVVWPPAGAIPVDEASRSEYFDSMYHSAAVVGVNTTAEIESAILGRQVFTVLAPEFRDTQEGTLHFDHLRNFEGGLVHVARDFAEHLAQLDAAVQVPDADTGRCRRFVEAFVRPHGIDVPATPRLVDALEGLALRPARRQRDPVWVPLVRPHLARRSALLAREAELAAAALAADRRISRLKHRAREAEIRAHEAERGLKEAEKRASQAAVQQARELHTMPRLVEGFHQLGEVDRRNFLRATFDAFPPLSYIELHAATRPRTLDYPHADISMRVMTDAEEFRLRACSKEPFTIEWIHRNIGPGDVLYDIGANVGAYSLVAAKKPGGGPRVFSFEPSYATVATLCTNIVLNDVGRLVTPIPVALSRTTGMNALGLRNLEPGGARHAFGVHTPGDGPVLYEQPVMTFRLDDLVELLGLPAPTHIKLDVDGEELAVLEGASSTLSSPLLRSMLVEVAIPASEQIVGLLARHRFRLESKEILKTNTGEYAIWYGVFVRNGGTSDAGR
jgi:FkbM family methyltransferase